MAKVSMLQQVVYVPFGVGLLCYLPRRKVSLSGFGTGFGTAEDLRDGAGGSPRISPIGRVAPRVRVALSAVPRRTFRKDLCDRSTT